MKQIGCFWLVILLLMLGSCKYSEEFYEVQQSTYRIELPDYVEAMPQKLNPNANFQYGNQFRNFYIVIEDRKKSENPNLTVSKYAQESFKNLSAVPTFSEPDTLNLKEIDLNGMKGQHLEMTAVIGNDRVNEVILYNLIHVESPTHYYHIALWTWKHWRDKYKVDMAKIFESFKEL